MVHRAPVPVTIPVPASVRARGGATERSGWIWVEHTLLVPVLKSDASVSVRRHDPTGAPLPSIRGACADGRHWRSLGRAPGRDAWTPFRLVHDFGGPACLVDGACSWSGCTVTPDRHVDLGTASEDASVRMANTPSAQDRLIRYHAVRDAGSRPDRGMPFDLRPGHVVTDLDGAFEARTLARLREILASVDGVPMMRTAPPSVVVEIGPAGKAAHAYVRYTDVTPRSDDHVTVVLPFAAHERVQRELAAFAPTVGCPSGVPHGLVTGRMESPDPVTVPVFRTPETEAHPAREERRAAVVEWATGLCARVVPGHGPDPAPVVLDALDDPFPTP